MISSHNSRISLLIWATIRRDSFRRNSNRRSCSFTVIWTKHTQTQWLESMTNACTQLDKHLKTFSNHSFGKLFKILAWTFIVKKFHHYFFSSKFFPKIEKSAAIFTPASSQMKKIEMVEMKRTCPYLPFFRLHYGRIRRASLCLSCGCGTDSLPPSTVPSVGWRVSCTRPLVDSSPRCSPISVSPRSGASLVACRQIYTRIMLRDCEIFEN